MTSERLVLPSDLVMSPVHTLSPEIRARLGGDDDDVVLSRPRHRRRGLVVSSDTAQLLESFREPTTMPEAVLLHAVRRSADATQLLAEAYPVLRQLRDARYLVKPTHAAFSANRPLLSPGSVLRRWRVERSLQTFDDSDVYCAADDTARVAIKVVRPGAPDQTLRLLRRERDVLEILETRGIKTPRVIDSQLAPGSALDSPDATPWLALSWVPGRTADAVAGQLRQVHGAASPALFRLCRTLVQAYIDLHEAGVLHGDVHPRNVLVDEDGSVTLVDFALAAVLDGRGPGVLRQRGGIGWAFEPELAASSLRHEGDVPVTVAAEQYSLAAVCFYLLTGDHHLNLPADRTAMFEQIAASDPRKLSSIAGVEDLHFADPAFARALERSPADRFPDLNGLARALDAQIAAMEAANEGPTDLVVHSLVGKLAVAPSRKEFDRFPAPRSTISYGAAGIALSLFRLAQLRKDAEMLPAAESWSALALTPQPEGRAVFNPDLGITDDSVNPTSLYHSATGIHLTDALIAQAVGDFDRAIASTHRFLDAAGPPNASAELVNGEAGLIAGAVLLVRALRTPSTVTTGSSVLAWLRPRAALLAESALADLTAHEPPLGLAHGVSGPVLAVSEAEAADAGPTLLGRELASALAEQLDRRAVDRWAISPQLGHSWCNGSAGAALALGVAARHTGDDRCLRGALELGRHASGYTGGNASLCCGATGVGYVLLYLSSLSDDPSWLEDARRMAARARGYANARSPHSHSLHKGALGAALLTEDIQHPQRVWFPGLLGEASWM
jgi:serine/threonine protein kinase